ncbi:MAG: polysaccharide deacetylase family protein [Vallitalea sp.]|jgi:peptidoglycan/xylan/chitin deacetylase (PgdA/CDA1 family)|nr:polysaccharide deacetylase family protein [Vallitalea sp.]
MRIRFPNGKKKVITFSYDDGVEQDIRLINLFKEYGIKGTFNLNSGLFNTIHSVFGNKECKRLSHEKLKQIYKHPNIEIGIHTVSHCSLPSVSNSNKILEVINDRNNLEQIFEMPLKGMAYPYGHYNDDTIKVLQDCGIVYSRTVQSHHSFILPTDWLKLGATCHHNDDMLMPLAHKFLDENPTDKEDPFMFYIWGHSYEFDRNNNWEVIEQLLKYTSYKEDVWYATNIEIYNYIDAYKNLIYSSNDRIIHNPSAISVWICSGDKTIELPSGSTVNI